MAHIGEVITQSDLKSLDAYIQSSIVKTLYVSPSVYRKSNGVSNWNYYNSVNNALKQFFFISGYKGYSRINPDGNISFDTPAATTFGINVDFFCYLPVLGLLPTPYALVKQWAYSTSKVPYLIIRFYKSNGSGPYYAVLDPKYLSITAKIYTDVPAEKVKALDDFNRTVQLLKARYNTLAKFMVELSKRAKTDVEQQIFDEGILTLIQFRDQLKDLKGVDIVWSNDGQISGPTSIGIVPLVWVAIICVSGAVIAYAFDKVTLYLKQAKVVEANFDTNTWIETQRMKIGAAVKAGLVTPEYGNYLNGKLDDMQKASQETVKAVIEKKDEDIFSKITKVLFLGGGLFLASKLIK